MSTTGACGIAEACGGCARIRDPYADQLRWKERRVRGALAKYDGLASAETAACLPAPEAWHYRNRAKLAVAGAVGGVRIGLYRRGSNRIVDLQPCLVHRRPVQEGIEILRAWLQTHALARPSGPVFYLDLREAVGNGCHLTLVVDDESVEPASLPLGALREAWPVLAGIALNYGDPRSSYPLGRRTLPVDGGEHFDAPLPTAEGGEVAMAVPISGFFQVSTALLPEVHRRMREHLGGGGPLYELYCGVGVHGLMVERDVGAHGGDGIVGVEESPAACAAACVNARRFGIRGEYYPGAVEERLGVLLRERPAARFILNPGRAGCRAPVPALLAAAPGARIAYLSCNPDTLARDLAVLVAAGRKVCELVPIDLMPHTDHVETLALVA